MDRGGSVTCCLPRSKLPIEVLSAEFVLQAPPPQCNACLCRQAGEIVIFSRTPSRPGACLF